MRLSLSRFWLMLAVLLVILSGSIVSAQTDRDVVSFSVGGQTHVIRLPHSRAARASMIESALDAIVPVYEKFWNATGGGSMAFPLFIDVDTKSTGSNLDLSSVQIQAVKLPVPSAPWNEQTEATPTTVCQVDLFNEKSLYASQQRLQFELAFDLAQCYLDHYTNPLANPPDWWFKGLSCWMAVQVYPPPSDVQAKLQKDFGDNYNQNLLNAGEEALYFWEYLLGGGVPAALKSSISGSLPEMVDGLKNLSGTVTFFTPDLFYAWARAVSANQLPWQPAPDNVAQDETVSDFPGDVELELETNSMVIENVALPELKPDEGVEIEADGLTDNGVLASVSAGGQGGLMLNDNTPVKICNPPESLTIVAGRGSQSALPDPSLTVNKVENCNPTPEATPQVTEGAGLPACVVGTFSVRFPFMEKVLQVTGGIWQFKFNNDGSFELLAQNLVMQNSNTALQLNYDYKGTIALVPDPHTDNRFNPTKFSVQIQPGGKALVQSGGTTMDMTPLYINSNQLAAPPVYITCANGGADNPTVNYYATAQYPVVLTRIG